MTTVAITSHRPASQVTSPLLHEGWLEFNRRKWKVETERVSLSLEAGLPAIDAVLLLDRRGKIVCPRTTPYIPLSFRSNPASAPYNQYRDYLELSAKFAQELKRRGLAGVVSFPPEIPDMRPFQWAGWMAEVRYTFYIDFPYNLNLAHHSVRRNLKKAAKDGFTCEYSSNLDDVHSCLMATEERKDIDYSLTTRDLELARSLIGSDCFRTYVCYSPERKPLASSVILFAPGARALYWIAGMKTGAGYGWTELLHEFMFRDLHSAGAAGLDFVGANIPGVAAAKAKWGARLVPFYALESWLRNSIRCWYHLLRSGVKR
jgi:hypothetical protein